MTRTEKIQLVFGTVLLATGLIWPVPQRDRSFTGMIVVPMMLWTSLFLLVPIGIKKRREIWAWWRSFLS